MVDHRDTSAHPQKLVVFDLLRTVGIHNDKKSLRVDSQLGFCTADKSLSVIRLSAHPVDKLFCGGLFIIHDDVVPLTAFLGKGAYADGGADAVKIGIAVSHDDHF